MFSGYYIYVKECSIIILEFIKLISIKKFALNNGQNNNLVFTKKILKNIKSKILYMKFHDYLVYFENIIKLSINNTAKKIKSLGSK